MTTLDDAIEALGKLETWHGLAWNNSAHLAVVKEFLANLQNETVPLKLNGDADGFILEHALDNGFSHIDDDIELLVVPTQKLIDFIKMREAWVKK